MSNRFRRKPDEVDYGEECPNCGSDVTVITQFDNDHPEAPHSPWCKECGYGWMEAN
jgi:transcription elongation factor Elf1